MNLQQFFLILKSRLLLILFVLVVSIATTVFVTNLIPKKYTAYTSLILDFQHSNPFEPLGLPAQLSASYMATQADIINSHNVALKVVDKLKLTSNPAYRQSFLEVTGGSGSFADWIADLLIEDLSVEPSRDSRVISISFQSTDPKWSAIVADTFADSYIETTLELNMEPAKRNAAWFDGQLKLLRTKLEEAQAKLTTYQQDKGIVAIDERLDNETRRLNELSSQLVTAQADTFDVKSRQLGENHPEYQRAIQREASVRQLMERQKAKILEIKKQRDELDVLAREVENAQRSYDSALQRFYQSSMESQFNQTNISVLNKAVPPLLPSSPKLALNIVIAIVLGLFFGIGLAILLETLNKKIRTEEDLSTGLGVPVLARI